MPRRIRPYLNAKCLKCGKVKRNMVIVGVFTLCIKCCNEEFKSDDPVINEHQNYVKWLAVYNKR